MNKNDRKWLGIVMTFFLCQTAVLIAYIFKDYLASWNQGLDIVSIFVLVEVVQSCIIIVQFYGTNNLLKKIMTDPEIGGAILKNAINGWIDEMFEVKDPTAKKLEYTEEALENQAQFFGFVKILGQAMYQGVREAAAGPDDPNAPVKPIKTGSKVADALLNLPEVRSGIGKKIASGLDKFVKTGAQKAGEGIKDKISGHVWDEQ